MHDCRARDATLVLDAVLVHECGTRSTCVACENGGCSAMKNMAAMQVDD